MAQSMRYASRQASKQDSSYHVSVGSSDEDDEPLFLLKEIEEMTDNIVSICLGREGTNERTREQLFLSLC